jgi:hypothetical protein
MVAIGIDWEGRWCVLAAELANRESLTSWKEFALSLKRRVLNGVELVVSDDHAGLRVAIQEVFPEAAWQRCYVHLLRNALDHLPRNADDECMTKLPWIYDRRTIEESRQGLAVWLKKWATGTQSYVTWWNPVSRKHYPSIACQGSTTDHEIHEPAGAAERRDQAPHVGRSYIFECGQLPSARTVIFRTDTINSSRPLQSTGR